MTKSIYSYNDVNNFNIDLLNVEDYILKYNTKTFIELEIIFNCNIVEIVNKYVVVFSLVNPNDNSIVYAQFTPLVNDFGVKKKTIPIGGGTNAYTQILNYFDFKYVDKNHFVYNNQILTSNSLTENSDVQLMVTIDGVDKLFGTKTINVYNVTYIPTMSSLFDYLQSYSLRIGNYYIQNSDDIILKLNNIDTILMSLNTIDNFSTVFQTPTRLNFTNDFGRTSTATAAFSGSNSYGLIDTYNIVNNMNSSVWIRKNGIEAKLNNVAQPNIIISSARVGSTKFFNTVLNKDNSVLDTVNIEVPLFKEVSTSGGLQLVSIVLENNNINMLTLDNSYTTINNLGSGKFQLLLKYNPSNHSNISATFTARIKLTFNHPLIGNIELKSTTYTYTNSN